MMEWEELSRRLRNGTSVQILADLDGVPYKTMYNRIKYYEKRDGKRYMPESTPRKTKGDTCPEEIQDSAADPEEVPAESPEEKKPICPDCIHNLISSCEYPLLNKGFGKSIACSKYMSKAEYYAKQLPPDDPEEVKPVIIPEDAGDFTEFKSGLDIPETIRREIHQKIIECTRKANEYQLLAEGWQSILKSIEEGKT